MAAAPSREALPAAAREAPAAASEAPAAAREAPAAANVDPVYDTQCAEFDTGFDSGGA
jgi:hypothetical protein